MNINSFSIKNITCKIYKVAVNLSAQKGKRTGGYWLKWQKELKKYENIHQGETAFLIGNGPSVRIEDLEKLKGNITFCCNKFYMSYADHSFRPTYTVSADDKMIEDFGNEIVRNSEGIVWFCSAFPIQQEEKEFEWVFLQSKKLRLEKDALLAGAYHTGATLLAALQIGYYMGIRKFVLYGVDHNFKYDSSDAKSSRTEGNHFIGNYREGKTWYVPNTERIEDSFRKMADLLESQEGWLINASRETKLPHIKRVLFEDCLLFAEQQRHFSGRCPL